MKIIGLCGRSGSGKSYVCQLAVGLGFGWVDADEVYRTLMAPSSEINACKNELTAVFGENVLLPDHSLNRAFLSELVFNSPEKEKNLELLNRTTHKYILDACMKRLLSYREEGCQAVILDAPTLFEARLDRMCDFLIGVVADDECCIKRICERDHIGREQAEKRLASQLSIADIKERCNFVIDNTNPTKEELLNQLLQIHAVALKAK